MLRRQILAGLILDIILIALASFPIGLINFACKLAFGLPMMAYWHGVLIAFSIRVIWLLLTVKVKFWGFNMREKKLRHKSKLILILEVETSYDQKPESKASLLLNAARILDKNYKLEVIDLGRSDQDLQADSWGIEKNFKKFGKNFKKPVIFEKKYCINN